VASAGKHELDFVNTEFGYQSRQVVEIKAGQIVPMKVSVPDGRVSINASPWASVSIDGNSAGETPIGNVALPVGEHQIVFRHPQLGERTQKVVVKANASTRVSVVFAR
jgi:serine/threonine-protein kinase